MTVIADAYDSKCKFLSKINDLYNQDNYFIESCHKFPSKYSLENATLDDLLRIYFEENNNVVLSHKTVQYCSKDVRRTIKLVNLYPGISDDTIVNNYITEDKWEATEW